MHAFQPRVRDKILSSGCVAKQSLLTAQQKYGPLVLSVDATGQASIHPPGNFNGQIVSPDSLVADAQSPAQSAVQMPLVPASVPDRLTNALTNGLGALSQARPQQDQSQYLSTFSPAIQSAVNSGTPYTPTGSAGSQSNGIVSGANGTFQVNGDGTFSSLQNGRTFSLT